MIGDQSRDANAKIDIKAIAQFFSGAGGEIIAGPGH
jgi:hypothetical protein